MSLKIKLFSSSQNNLASLEDEVNAWTSVNSDCNIRDIKVSFSDHNILMTILYEAASKSVQKASNQELKPSSPQSFEDALASYRESQQPNNPEAPRQNNFESPGFTPGTTDPNSIKPGRLIQNNYSKYNKSNQKYSEDQAFNWD